MKFLLTIFLSYIFYTSLAQLGPVVGTRVQANANLLPPLDTVLAPYRVGEVRAQVVSGVAYFYVCRSLSADKKWDVFALSPMTSVGDLIIGGTSGLPTRLALGTNGYVPKSNGTTVVWSPDDAGSATPGGTTGAVQWRGSTGAFTGDTSIVAIDSANKRVGFRMGNPNLPVSFGSPASLGGVGFYSTTDLTNYQRMRIYGTAANAWYIAFENAGTGGAGSFSVRSNASDRLVVDNSFIYAYTNFRPSTTNTFDIGTATVAFRNGYYDAGVRIGLPSTTRSALLHLGAGTATASTAPLKFTAGAILTTAESGVLETDGGNNLFYTNATAVRGRLQQNRTLTSAAGTLSVTDNYNHYVFTGSTSTWTLPAVSGTANVIYYIKNRGSGVLTINTTSGNEIYETAAVATINVSAGAALVLFSDGTYYNVE